MKKMFVASDRAAIVKILSDTTNVGVLKRGGLVAKANRHLKVLGLTWDDVLKPVLSGSEGQEWLRQQNVEKVFQTILRGLKDDEPRRFIQSLQGQFARKGTLTEGQCIALKKFHDNLDDDGCGGAPDYGDDENPDEDPFERDELNGLF